MVVCGVRVCSTTTGVPVEFVWICRFRNVGGRCWIGFRRGVSDRLRNSESSWCSFAFECCHHQPPLQCYFSHRSVCCCSPIGWIFRMCTRETVHFAMPVLVVRSPFRAKHHVVVQYMARWMKCPLPPSPLNTLALPNPPAPRPPSTDSMTCGKQGGQGRIDDITGKGLRTAVALSTASCSVVEGEDSARQYVRTYPSRWCPEGECLHTGELVQRPNCSNLFGVCPA